METTVFDPVAFAAGLELCERIADEWSAALESDHRDD